MNFKEIFEYTPHKNYNFTLLPDNTNIQNTNFQPNNIYSELELNLNHIKFSYNTKINSDIAIREFTLTAKNITYKSFLIYIDGMVDSTLINRFILDPLMLRNENNTFNRNSK